MNVGWWGANEIKWVGTYLTDGLHMYSTLDLNVLWKYWISFYKMCVGLWYPNHIKWLSSYLLIALDMYSILDLNVFHTIKENLYLTK